MGVERPAIVTREHLEYLDILFLEHLDDLCETGRNNKFGSGTYVEAAFGLNKHEAKTVVSYWIKTFGKDDR